MDRFGLDEEQRALLDVVHKVARDRLAPQAAADDASGRFPAEAVAELAAMDLLSLPFDSQVGGGGQPYATYLRVLEELARAHVVVALTVSVHTLATGVVAIYARPEVAAEVLPLLLSGQWLAAYCLSEPGSGSDAAALATRAARDGDGWVLDGTKAWVTHAGVAGCYVVLARTGAHRTRGISAFLVPADTPGIAVQAPERKMGMAASPTAQIVLEGVRVPGDHLLGEEGEGFPIALSALDGGRLGIAACATGLGQAAVDHAVAYAGEREQFGQPIGSFQGVGFLLADSATAVASGRALYRDAAARRDAGESHGELASMAKLVATDAAMQAAIDAVQVLGGYGYTAEHPVERYLREAKVMQIFEGTNQIQRVVIARSLLGP